MEPHRHGVHGLEGSRVDNFALAVSHALSRLKKDSLKLKPKQVEAIRMVYENKDVFVWLPTGYGKSICFHVLPYVFDFKLGRVGASPNKHSVVLIVCPLVSLMVDQVSELKTRGVQAAILSGNRDVEPRLTATEADIQAGKFTHLYTSPEAVIGVDRWRRMLAESPLSEQIVAVVIDEAHCVYKWSSDFRPTFSRLHELRALLPYGVPTMALTATVTNEMRKDVIERLDMQGCSILSASPDRPNILYRVFNRTSLEEDMAHIVQDVRINNIKASRVIIYCRSLNMCAELYAHFLYTLGDKSYYPSGAPELCENRLFAMFHSSTPKHNKDVVLQSMTKESGIVRVVFATTALGMGVNFVGLYSTIHYGAPRSIDDYFQESGRAGRDGRQALSTIYWIPSDAPNKKDLKIHRNAEIVAVRQYLENRSDCRRYQLLRYFDPELVKSLTRRDPTTCCDVCQHGTITHS